MHKICQEISLSLSCLFRGIEIHHDRDCGSGLGPDGAETIRVIVLLPNRGEDLLCEGPVFCGVRFFPKDPEGLCRVRCILEVVGACKKEGIRCAKGAGILAVQGEPVSEVKA